MSTETSVGHYPDTEKWEFDHGVTAVFDDMLARSIPQYHEMRTLTFDIGQEFVQPKTAVVDLGCSRGEALDPFIRTFGAYNRYVGVEVSEPMLEAARSRYAGYIDSGVVDIRNLDLRSDYPHEQASLTLCVLTLMFTPIQYRLKIIQNIARHTVPGGAVILVEKLLGASADIDELMVDRYHRMKHEQGYSWDEIERKRMALEGVQVPVTAAWNEDLLRSAGFSQVDCFWRWMNFAGWIAVK
jgi:tRNA (cmo5U34)-methyltransferase